jgi:hypothetical protein
MKGLSDGQVALIKGDKLFTKPDCLGCAHAICDECASFNDWIDWTGSAKIPPLDGDTAVEVQRRDGSSDGGMAYLFGWEHVGAPNDILRYRVWHHEAKAAPIQVAQPQSEPSLPSDGWIEWSGGHCPVPAKAVVEFMARGGYIEERLAGELVWRHSNVGGDIVSYRVVVQPQAEPIHAAQPQSEPSLPSDGWIEWLGGNCPVNDMQIVEVQVRSGSTYTDYAGEWVWAHEGTNVDIFHYRVVPVTPKVEPIHAALNTLSSEKPTNPKDAIGVRKVPMSVVPSGVLMETALGMLEGASKYGRHNYRAMGVRASVYYDAAMGHMMDWWEGEDIDPDSGLSHVTKAICSLVVLRDAMLQGKFTDDRPPRSKVFKRNLNDKAAEILDKHADKKPHHYTIADNPKED